MFQESITYEEKVFVFTGKSAFMNHKVAFFMWWFIQILFWINFKNVIAHLKSNRAQFWCNIFATVFYVTECFIWCTIQVWKGSWPFFSDFFKYIRRNRKLRASSINNCWIWSILSWFLHWFSSIKHALTFKCPCSKPILKVLERF